MSESDDIEVQSTETLQQTRKRGRPKKIQDMKEYMKDYRKEYDKKRYKEKKDQIIKKNTEYQNNRYKNDEEFREKVKENNKEYHERNYEKNKDKIIEHQKQLQHKYRLALNILKKLIQNDKIPSEYKDEVTLICT
jgi:hypothetical protein